MSQLSGNSCSIITLLPLGVECESVNATTPLTSNGLISLFITGGTPPYYTTWSNGTQGSYIFNLSHGSYTATTVDYYGDFSATTVCNVGYDQFYLEMFENCRNNNVIYYRANLPSNYQINKVYVLQGQTGCWTNKGQVLTTGQTYIDAYATTTAGPYNACKGCVTIEPPTVTKPNQICLTQQTRGRTPIVTNIQFSSGSTINGKESWTSATPSYTIYYNSGTTFWEISGWTGSGVPKQTPYIASPIGNWVVYGGFDTTVQVYVGACVNKPIMSLKVKNTTCLGSNDGVVTINASSGTPPYQYSLNNILYQSSNMFIGLSEGNYTAYVKDSLNEVSSQTFTVNPLGLPIQYSISLIEQPIATPVINNLGNYTEITHNFLVNITPTPPVGKTFTFDIVHTVNMNKRSGISTIGEVSPTLLYNFTTGTTTGGAITGYSISAINTTTTNPPACPDSTLYTTGYTEVFNSVISGVTGTITGQITKKITTPNASLNCQSFGLINDVFTITNVKLLNQTVCETFENKSSLVFNLQRTGVVGKFP